MSRVHRWIIPLFLSFLSGVFLASIFSVPFWLIGFAAFLALLCALLFLVERGANVLLVVACCVGISIGMLHYTLWNTRSDDPHLQRSIGQRVVVRGVISDEPDVREGKTHLTVTLSLLRSSTESHEVQGKLIAFADRYPEYHYGDEILLTGTLAAPQVFQTDSGRVFDYPQYLKGKGIRYQMSFASIEQVGEEKGNSIIAELLAVKQRFTSALELALPSPESALLSGLLLGGKQSLGVTWIERFQQAGIIHIVVLSGYNMTVVAEWLVVAFRFLGFAASLSIGALGIVLFAIMTGAGATVVRAAILALLVLLAKVTGRVSEMGRALLFAGVVMVAVNPSLLCFDPSFQLSFLASLGLVYVSPIFERWISIGKRHQIFREVLISTLATQVTVLPLLLYQTGMLSLVALPVNLIVLPLIPLSMLLGFLSGVGTLLLPSLATLFGLPVYLPLSFIFTIADLAARIPLAVVPITLSASVVALSYIALVVFVMRDRSAPLRVQQKDEPLD
jgi:competence protein ComEC